jgi:hypothetical protein
LETINLFLDPLLIAPYRALDDPVLAWWLATLWLAGLSILLGELTLALGKRLNRAPLAEHAGQAKSMQDMSMAALKAGDKPAYKAMNKLANESFGRAFFQRAALGAASLWPAFLAAGWLQRRFAGVPIPLPLSGGEINLGWLQGFLICYLGLRLGLALVRRQRRRPQPPPAAQANPPE